MWSHLHTWHIQYRARQHLPRVPLVLQVLTASPMFPPEGRHTIVLLFPAVDGSSEGVFAEVVLLHGVSSSPHSSIYRLTPGVPVAVWAGGSDGGLIVRSPSDVVTVIGGGRTAGPFLAPFVLTRRPKLSNELSKGLAEGGFVRSLCALRGFRPYGRNVCGEPCSLVDLLLVVGCRASRGRRRVVRGWFL